MATYKIGKTYILSIFFYLGLFNSHCIAQARQRVLIQAVQDIGKFEGVNNTGFTVKYHNEYFKHYKRSISLTSAYCGMALFSWHSLGGVNVNMKHPETAYKWFVECKRPKTFLSMTTTDFNNLKVGTAIIYRLNHGYHVGMIVKAKDYTLTTIEANTSTNRSIKHYNRKGQGVFLLSTRLNSRGITPFAVCDCINSN